MAGWHRPAKAELPANAMSELRLLARATSFDGTVKLSFGLKGGHTCDSCLLDLAYRRFPLVVCVSTQVGCPYDCRFCAVGQGSFSRSLSVQEISEQILLSRMDPWWASKDEDGFEVAAMGTGEPMLVLDQLMDAIRIAKSRDEGLVSLNLATIGIPARIRQFARERVDKVELNLQLSLHATTDDQRRCLMPRAAQFALGDVLDAACYFSQLRKKRVTANYLLVRGVNDSEKDAHRLVELLDPRFFEIKISVLNPIPLEQLQPSPLARLTDFCALLQSEGLQARVFGSAGVDIGAGCGQFSNSLLTDECEATLEPGLRKEVLSSP